MNPSQFHLALTHVPVILSIIGLVVLIISLINKNNTLSKTAFYLLLFAGIFAIPVYLTGEGTEEVVEHLPGVSENIIGRHEDIALIGLVIILITGLLALTALLFSRYNRFASVIRMLVLLFAVASAIAMTRTAQLGGEIRHTEARSSFVSSNAGNNEGSSVNGEAQEKDDD
jgi:uncharacterized membrane protein